MVLPKDIEDVGGAPYSVLRPILLKIDSAAQLRELEEKSAHLREDDEECWQRLIKRDFRIESEKHQLQPQDSKSWCELYYKYDKLVTDMKREAEAKLHNSFNNIEKAKAKNVAQIVNFNPKELRAPKDGKGFGFGRGGKRDENTGGLRFTGGSRTKTNNAQNIIKKARREAMEIGRRNKLATPTGALPVRPGQITRAPMGMVEEYRIKALPAVKKIHAPQPRREDQYAREQKEREEKLLSIKNGTAPKGANQISSVQRSGQDAVSGNSSKKPTASAQTTKSAPMPTPSKSAPRPPTPTAMPTPSLAIMKRGQSWKKADIQVVPVSEKPASNLSFKPTASKPSKSGASLSDLSGQLSQPSSLATPGRSPIAGLGSEPGPSSSPSQSATPGPNSEPKPIVGRKRKEPVSIFMPKPKARRLS
ncbi:hypothetical protein AAE478_000274 [Parahypoxylon ruwenzoriense]